PAFPVMVEVEAHSRCLDAKCQGILERDIHAPAETGRHRPHPKKILVAKAKTSHRKGHHVSALAQRGDSTKGVRIQLSTVTQAVIAGKNVGAKNGREVVVRVHHKTGVTFGF